MREFFKDWNKKHYDTFYDKIEEENVKLNKFEDDNLKLTEKIKNMSKQD
jgi:hypothetical protein